jgi:cellulose synthase/poly-beta-1,6-N-acetylglucosamine synthase-like glycosyltransferase
MVPIEIVLWASIGLVGYSYIGYPILLLALAKLMKRGRSDAAQVASETHDDAFGPGADFPSVSVLIAARNEERHIGARIANLLALNYPAHLLDIHVASDGSTDSTGSILQVLNTPRVHAYVFDVNRGKAAVLNDLVAHAKGSVLVFSDANTNFAVDAVVKLVDHFRDPRVGCVCGELRMGRRTDAGDSQENTYWAFERALKKLESKIDGLLGANGAIYAIRRELYVPLEGDTIIDDFCIAMNVAVTRKRVIYEPRALAFEAIPDFMREEFQRRVRIGIGNYRAFARHPEYLLRTSWSRRFTYFSHKVLRWFTPHLLILALCASAALAAESLFYCVFFAIQVFAYVGAGACCFASKHVPVPRPIRIPVYFLMLNSALFLASLKAVWVRPTGTWTSVAR